ncbi:MAG: CapA family protein [Clostridia bacterium]|nr:CapA family protein [Clostridia bacterium]
MKFTAAGDALIQRRIYDGYEGFGEIREYIEKGDARVFNFESTLNYEGECFASQFSGGTYIRTNPEVFGDCLGFGFNMTSFNNNHAMDFSYEGLLKTIDYVNEYDIPHSGVGRNLGEASAPCYLDTENGRVALISVNTSFNPAMLAGEQSRRFKGRPGINGLRHQQTLFLNKEDFEKIKEIGEKSGVNVAKNITIAEGYAPELPEGIYEMGDLRFEVGEETKRVTKCNKEDLERIKKSIFEAQLQSDYIIVSIHSHELSGFTKETPSEFLEEFAHFCIDNGANAVVGHGPHLLRPIEIYKNRPIFYSLGDFILQLYSVNIAPEDFFKKQGLTSDSTVHELLKKRSANFTRGLMADKKMNETVVPYWETDENGDLTYLELLPLTLSMGGKKSDEGLPFITDDNSFIKRLAEMSAPYGTKIEMKGKVAVCKW